MLGLNWRRWLKDPWLARVTRDLQNLAGRYLMEPGGVARLMDDVPKAVRGLESTARVYVRDPQKLTQLLIDATEKAKQMDPASGPLEEVTFYLMTFLRLLSAYARGQYRDVSTRALILMTAAVLYFVSPLDLIPDVVVGLGLIDDAAVIALVSRPIKGELDKFVAWERGEASASAQRLLSARAGERTDDEDRRLEGRDDAGPDAGQPDFSI